MKNKVKVWLNGQFYSEHQAKISIFDRGFLFGDSVYDSLITYNKRPLFFSEHYTRFKNSAAKLDLKLKISKKNLQLILHQIRKKILNGDHH